LQDCLGPGQHVVDVGLQATGGFEESILEKARSVDEQRCGIAKRDMSVGKVVIRSKSQAGW